MKRSTVFVGSSMEGHEIAKAIQVLLDPLCDVTIWSQGVFGVGKITLESLMLAVTKYDFAILVLTPDDIVESRGSSSVVPRDNIIFELGLFIGSIGYKRTFVVQDKNSKIRLPSDLVGLTSAKYMLHDSNNLVASLGAATYIIEQQIKNMGSIKNSGDEYTEIKNEGTSKGVTIDLIIHSARYGKGAKIIDVTERISQLVEHNKLSVRVDNEIGGDPCYGVYKNLFVDYSWKGNRGNISEYEGRNLRIP